MEREHILTWLMTLGRGKVKITSVYDTFNFNTYAFWEVMSDWRKEGHIVVESEDIKYEDKVLIEVYYKLSDKAINSLEE